jgi:hypothetical protein
MLGSNDSILHHQLCYALYLLWVIQYPKALVMNYNVLVQHHTLPDTNFPFFLVLRQDMVLSSCYGRRLYTSTPIDTPAAFCLFSRNPFIHLIDKY